MQPLQFLERRGLPVNTKDKKLVSLSQAFPALEELCVSLIKDGKVLNKKKKRTKNVRGGLVYT